MVLGRINGKQLDIAHNYKNVREFIDKELMQVENKENKYFKICTKKDYDGRQNLILYFQDGQLKSHHSTGKKFDYHDVLDYEIFENYHADDICMDYIISVDCDCKEEIEEKLKGNEVKLKDLKMLLMSEEEKEKKRLIELEENRLIYGLKEGCELNENSLEAVLNILVKLYKSNINMKSELKELRRKLYDNEQKIKWLEKYSR